MKNTSVNPSATFDHTPRPNQIEKIGARITRGIELAALTYGSKTADAVGLSASHMPIASPPTVPITNAATVSNIVTARCMKISPVTNHSTTRANTFHGSPKKNAAWWGFEKYNGGSSVGLVSTCQLPMNSTSTSNW